MDEIKWCLKQKNGLELVEPNEELTKAYVKKAEDSLRAVAKLKDNKDWEISSSYYTMYFSLYAILMKIGVKCEIHSCTISFMKRFLNKYFTPEEIELVEKSQKARIDTQYYSDRNISDELYERMINKASLFLARCKNVLNDLTEKEIEDIRSKLK
ncbi:MAG: HEPN domain-containing protein [Nanoarchaeota archaeon]|nr:HEPN domain-containing protein [Nanoarchaeota archaeon]MBU1444902.1 HEPN domain-containing protein [Nanoarchaeota archaeon]MBU2420221.1 HEPN domain-containing protein [Nanoarchaeota archaeon]MBU2475225.1 HEPN domain-containing protein [Nanoarchaeota archaeon]MBU3941149.1 HEPN domain-containing protein [Nanoarchaeota archaeon]